MANNFFWTGLYTALSRLTSARAEAVQAIFAAVETGFNLLPTPAALQNDAVTYCDDTGLANAYVVTLPLAASQVAISTYTEGLHVPFKALNANTGSSTINVNGIGVKNITHYDGSPLIAGDIPALGIAELYYDGTQFQLINAQAITGASNAVASAAAAAASAASAVAASGSAGSASASATAAAASAVAAAASLPSFILQAQGIR